MALLLRLLLLVSALLCAAAASNDSVTPVDNVVEATPGAFYLAKLQCYDCPHHEWQGTAPDREYKLVYEDVGLLFNITLSPDRRSVLLNDQPVFPTLQTIPSPPGLWIPQVRPDFSHRNFSSALGCREPQCLPEDARTLIADGCRDWCHELQLDKTDIDYLYITRSGTSYDGKGWHSNGHFWEFAVDALGAYSGYTSDAKWGFDSPSQKMLKVIVEGTVAGEQDSRGKAADGLFAPAGEEPVYLYTIRDVSLVHREFKFPPRQTLSLRAKVSRFFGNDVWQADSHRLVYLRSEWDQYGKKGTLRSVFGHMIHWHLWPRVWLILASALAALAALLGAYRLFFWAQAQRRLMKWSGIDDMWDNLRREGEEEENRLLHGHYRDDPDEDASSRPSMYRDDVDTMKPLPAKPLPDKPLPNVPLIDA